MKTKLRALQSRLKGFTVKQLDAIILITISQHEQEILNSVRGQLYSGIDGTGNELKAYSSTYYAAKKLRLNPFGVTDLRLTGNFYNSFFLSASKFPVTIGATDKKTGILMDNYGNKILHLTDGNKDKLVKQVKKEILTAYKRIL